MSRPSFTKLIWRQSERANANCRRLLRLFGNNRKKIVSVSSRFSYILRKLGRNKKQKFISFFERSTSRSEMVATFMAMLALVKSKKVEINGDGGDAEVTLITDRR